MKINNYFIMFFVALFTISCQSLTKKHLTEFNAGNIIKAIRENDIKYIKNLDKNLLNRSLTEQQRNALIIATAYNKIDIVKFLIQNGVDVNAIDSSGFTSLMYACKNGNYDIVKILVPGGSNINYKNKDGYSALFVTSSGQNENIILIMEFLINHGADINNGRSLLNNVLVYPEYMRYIISKGANVNVKRNLQKRTILMHAVGCDAIEPVKILLGSGAKVNCIDCYGETALDIAIALKNKEMINILRKYGAETAAELKDPDYQKQHPGSIKPEYHDQIIGSQKFINI